jgi:hypothetical protein
MWNVVVRMNSFSGYHAVFMVKYATNHTFQNYMRISLPIVIRYIMLGINQIYHARDQPDISC